MEQALPKDLPIAPDIGMGQRAQCSRPVKSGDRATHEMQDGVSDYQSAPGQKGQLPDRHNRCALGRWLED
jgi:hypothetical protein